MKLHTMQTKALLAGQTALTAGQQSEGHGWSCPDGQLQPGPRPSCGAGPIFSRYEHIHTAKNFTSATALSVNLG
jgi:hypothetical protein